MVLADIPGKIREARKGEGLEQKDLARLADLSYHAIASYEQGRRTPRLDALGRIAVATGKPLTFFFGEDGVTSE